MPAVTALVTALHVYPVKSCRGLSPPVAALGAAGLEDDRRWLVIAPDGRFLTQREAPRLALVETAVDGGVLTLRVPDGPRCVVERSPDAASRAVVVWRDRCAGVDCGDAPAALLSRFLGREVRLVEFDPTVGRRADPAWAGEVVAPVRYADGFPLLLASEESLADLNGRLPAPLPMERFRPNIVVRGLGAFGEDRVRELRSGAIRLRPVKACTRCSITTTNQATGEVAGDEPLRTLKGYRWDARLRGVTFGQNVVVVAGDGATLAVGQRFEVDWA
jgi:uncharacterized protein YcbX